MQHSDVINLVGERRAVVDTVAVTSAARSQIPRITLPFRVGTHTCVLCIVKRSEDVGNTIVNHFVTVVIVLLAKR